MAAAPLRLDGRLCGAIFAWLSLHAVAVCTHFNPDEYWQSLEVAHQMVFGCACSLPKTGLPARIPALRWRHAPPTNRSMRRYGHLTWEWAPETQLRGYAHPLLFAALYKLLALLGLDGSTAVMVYSPRILMAACAAACDCAVYRLARRWFDDGTARWALACSLLAWFNCFCAVRPFANCLEATLCAAALALWPFAPSPSAGPEPPPPPPRVAALLLGAGKTAACLAVVPKDLEGTLNAKDWVNSALGACGGKGGGKPGRAQGAARDAANVKAAEAAAKAFASEKLAIEIS